MTFFAFAFFGVIFFAFARFAAIDRQASSILVAALGSQTLVLDAAAGASQTDGMRFSFRGLALATVLAVAACGSSDSTGGTKDPADGGTTQPGDPPGPPPNPDIVKTTNETLTVNGNARGYTLAVPVTYDSSKKYPLVVSLHGDGGDGAGMQASTPYEVTSKQDAIVVYPNGQDKGWDLYTAIDSNADLQFLQQLVPAVAAKYNVDTSRVLGFGYSSGAFMVNQVACKIDGLFRAIAPNEGGAPADDPDGNSRTCVDGKAVGVFVFHGEADKTVDIGSGVFETQFWAERNGCGSDEGDDIDPSPCKRKPNCNASAPVTFCKIPNQDHVVWSRAVEASWSFFKALP